MVKESQFSLQFESFMLGISSIVGMLLSIPIWLQLISKWHTLSSKTKRGWKIGLLILWMGCLTMLGLSLIYYREDKEADVTDLPSLVQQVRRKQVWEEQGRLDEGLALFMLAATLILIGVGWCSHDLLHRKSFTWLSSLIYTIGWLLMSTVACLNNPTLLSIDNVKMAICFPSAFCLVAASFWLPFQPNWAWPVTVMGGMLFQVGHSLAR